MQAHILVSGRVQGVLFRSNTRKQAEKLGIAGWVRNTPDGRVEIIAQGSRESLEKLISWCQKGPLFAKVGKIQVEWEKLKESFSSFEIIY